MATSPTDDALYGSEKDGNSFDKVSTPTSEGTDMGSQELASPISETPEEHAQRMTELKEELEKVEGEIAMLRQVLGSKVRHATELKRQIGITPFQEFKQDLSSGFQQIKSSDSYQKTNDTFQQFGEKMWETKAYQKTSAVMKTATEKTSSAINTMGQVVAKKMGDIKNSNTFKSFDEKVHNTYANVKAKVTGSRSSNEIDEALREAQVSPDGQVTLAPDSNSNTPLVHPEEKVPL